MTAPDIAAVAASLSEVMAVELQRLCDLRLPESFRKQGFTGFPERCVERREAAQERRGLAAASYHSWNMGNGWRTAVQWRATPLGMEVRRYLEGRECG